MRRLITWTMTLLTGAATVPVAFGQNARPQAAAPKSSAAPPAVAKPAPKPSPIALTPEQIKAKADAETRARNDMEQLLAEWEKQSTKVKSLQVVFERIDRSVKWGDQVYQGQAILKSPDLACLEFKKAIPDANGKPKRKTDAKGQAVIEVEKEPFQRIVCTGKEVLQYEWDEKAIYIYPLDKESRQKALQQGPLPFLFNMKAADAKRRYGMTLLAQEKKPNDYLIAIVPREEIDKQSFNKAFVYLDKKTFLPSQLYLYPVGEKDTQEFNFTLIAPNKVIDDAYFHPSINLPNWKVNRNDPGVAAAAEAPVDAPVVPANANARGMQPAPGKRAAPATAPRTASGRP